MKSNEILLRATKILPKQMEMYAFEKSKHNSNAETKQPRFVWRRMLATT